MIDPVKVKSFWDSRAQCYSTLPLESVANLEQDPENLKLKINDEVAKVFSWLPDLKGKRILDLGAGVGQWTFRFAERGAADIVAVEYSAGLAEIGAAEARKRNYSQVAFQVSPAEMYRADKPFDVVFISGLFVYLNDDQALALAQNLPGMVDKEGLVLLRDGTGIAGRHEINDRMSDHLGVRYSATYRTRQQYIDLFSAAGFVLKDDENMFPEGHPLNKYPETRLRLYRFVPA